MPNVYLGENYPFTFSVCMLYDKNCISFSSKPHTKCLQVSEYVNAKSVYAY